MDYWPILIVLFGLLIMFVVAFATNENINSNRAELREDELDFRRRHPWTDYK